MCSVSTSYLCTLQLTVMFTVQHVSAVKMSGKMYTVMATLKLSQHSVSSYEFTQQTNISTRPVQMLFSQVCVMYIVCRHIYHMCQHIS